MKNNSTRSGFRAALILYWLLPLLGLGLPIIIYILTYNPVLTPQLTTLSAYTQYLASTGSHNYASDWQSSIMIIPFSVKYFMTIFAAGDNNWSSVLFNSVVLSYSLQSLAFILMFATVRARRFVTYLAAALLAAAIGTYSLLTSYSASSFMFFSFVFFLSLAFLILGIRLKLKLPVRICISVLCIFPAIAFLTIAGKNLKQASPEFSVMAELKASLRSPLGQSGIDRTTDDCELNSRGLIAFLNTNSLPKISSAPEISNTVSVCSLGQIELPTAPNITGLSYSSDSECRYIPTGVPEYDGRFVYIVSSADTAVYNQYSFLCSELYSDQYYTVYCFDHPGILSDSTILADLSTLNSSDYDAAFLYMYDISNYDTSYFTSFMGWNCVDTKHIFSTTNYLDYYNSFIFKNTINQYIFGIDPYIMYACSDFDASAYRNYIAENITEMIRSHSLTTFYLYFPSYGYNHFRNYTAAELTALQQSYDILLEGISKYENVQYYYAGHEEYIYYNQYIYEPGSDCLMNESTANFMFLENLSDNTRVTPDELSSDIGHLAAGILNYSNLHPSDIDLSDYHAVIFGDSIFGSFTDNTGIQAILGNYSGMSYTLRAIGGASAATTESSTISLKNQYDIAAVNLAIASDNAQNKELLFIIEFGLNDYFNSLPVTNKKDKYDETTYSGMIRTCVESIQNNWPGSTILIISPGYVAMRDYGEEPYNPGGPKLSEYRNAANSIADEYDLLCFDLTKAGITHENCFELIMLDRTHYNCKGRFNIAWSLMEYLNNTLR